MRLGIFSDIHGNLEALEAVLKAMEDDNIDMTVHLGDLVGYNANPAECVDLVHRSGSVCIMGNHDLAVLQPQVARNFNVIAHEALHYARGQLHGSSLRFLKGFHSTFSLMESVLFCHGTPDNLFSYILNVFQARRAFHLLRKQHPSIKVCFYGHTHQQKVWVLNLQGKVFSLPLAYSSILLNPDNRYLINPGSVGQPRQQDNRARYLIFDFDRQIVSFKAVPYDIAKTQQKILQAGLPEYLAIRLGDGV